MQRARTENYMRAHAQSGNACVDLFFNAGAMRGSDITPLFAAAYAEDRVVALRLALWLRDARQGAGEHEHFRKIVQWLFDRGHVADGVAVMNRIHNSFMHGWWLGLITPDEFYKKAKFRRKGERDGDYVVRANCYELPISELEMVDG